MNEPREVTIRDRDLNQISLLRKSTTRTVLYYLACVLTLGLAKVLFFWFPSLYQKLYFKSLLRDADHVQVSEKKSKAVSILELQRGRVQRAPYQQPANLVFFEFKHFKFALQNGCFEQIRSPLLADLKEAPGRVRGLRRGLEPGQATALGDCWGPNVIDIRLTPLFDLFMREVFTPFTFFQFFSFAVWYNNEYVGYANVILFMTLCSICLTVFETRKQNRLIRRMSFLDQPVHVFRRDDQALRFDLLKASSLDLRPGDLVFLEPNQKVPADLLLLSGKCVIDESLITGESTPCLKQEASEVAPVAANNLLFSGTTCLVSEKGARPVKFGDHKVSHKISHKKGEGELEPEQETQSREASLQTKQFIEEVSENLSQSGSHSLSREEMIILQSHELKNRTEKDHILGGALGVVVDTGFYTAKGSLIRDLLFQSVSNSEFKKDSLKFLGLLSVFVFLGFVWNVVYCLCFTDLDMPFFKLMIRSLDLFTTAIPPTLPLSLLIGIEFAGHRLKTKGIFSMIPGKINQAGRVKLFCFDKTGTLTENSLVLRGLALREPGLSLVQAQYTDCTQVLNRKEFRALGHRPPSAYFELDRGSSQQQLIEAMGLCHSLSHFKEELIGDPLDLLMFKQSGFLLVEREGLSFLFPSESFAQKMGLDPGFRFKVIKRLEFTPERKRMSVLVSPEVHSGQAPRPKSLFFQKKTLRRKKSLDVIISSNSEVRPGPPSRTRKNSGHVRYKHKKRKESLFSGEEFEERNIAVYCKGAPEVIEGLCTPQSVPKDFGRSLDRFAREGLRVLAVGVKVISQLALDQLDSVQDIEQGLHFVGFLLFENPLKGNTKTNIDTLQRAGVGTVMITGDNLLTATSVSMSCGIAGETSEICRVSWNPQSEDLRFEVIQRGTAFDPDSLKVKNFEEFDELIMADAHLRSQEKAKRCNSLKNTDYSSLTSRNQSLENGKDMILLEQSKSSEEGEGRTRRNKRLRGEVKRVVDSPAPVLFAMSGSTFEFLQKEGLLTPGLLLRTRVFGRSNPEQKAGIVSQFQGLLSSSDPNNFVGFCGDGANDCLALKRADVGLSLTQTEASIAAPFSTTTQDISPAVDLLREGKCCLQIAIENFMLISFMAVAQYVGQLTLYMFLTEYTNGHYYYQDLGFNFIFIFLVSRAGPSQRLSARFPPGNLLNPPVMLRVLTPLFLVLVYVVAYAFAFSEEPTYINVEDSVNEPGFENEGFFFLPSLLVFYLVIWAYVAGVFVVAQGPPFKQRLTSNLWLLAGLVLNILFLLFLPFYNNLVVVASAEGGFFNSLKYYFLFVVNSFLRVQSMSWHTQVLLAGGGIFLFLLMIVVDKVLIAFLIRRYESKRNRENHKHKLQCLKSRREKQI